MLEGLGRCCISGELADEDVMAPVECKGVTKDKLMNALRTRVEKYKKE